MNKWIIDEWTFRPTLLLVIFYPAHTRVYSIIHARETKPSLSTPLKNGSRHETKTCSSMSCGSIETFFVKMFLFPCRSLWFGFQTPHPSEYKGRSPWKLLALFLPYLNIQYPKLYDLIFLCPSVPNHWIISKTHDHPIRLQLPVRSLRLSFMIRRKHHAIIMSTQLRNRWSHSQTRIRTITMTIKSKTKMKMKN